MLSFLQCKVSLEAAFLVLFFSLNNSRVVIDWIYTFLVFFPLFFSMFSP